ncbi:hypothetical protein M9194_02100 [Vibrio sp. S4M6]|uniref:hypothetical protein n=1 Tax=Vibrio sinus TaxID=2946865 RepID=UPI00202A3C86|nr:hypothetical protein [Vibrio sinus]MCL9780222.1 hypothetical protein [Vibrio sinus]
MAKTIVFFNLADMHEHGLAKTSVKALENKYPKYSCVYEFFAGANKVYQINLFGLLKGDSDPKSGVPETPINLISRPEIANNPILRERSAITMLCSTADKIMLGIHGNFDNTEEGFAGLGWGCGTGVVGSYREFTKLLSSFLMPTKHYKLSLIVCFGARSQNYKVNHDGDIDEYDIKSSFAYKFYSQICTKFNVTMTARTGSVSFDSQTGRSLVQSEAAVRAAIEDAEIQSAEQTKRVARDYQQLQEFMTRNEDGQKKYMAMLERMDNPHALPRNPPERIIKSYNTIRTNVSNLSSLSSEMLSKYGKFVYSYDAGVVTVCRKYEQGQKVMNVLYQGAL